MYPSETIHERVGSGNVNVLGSQTRDLLASGRFRLDAGKPQLNSEDSQVFRLAGAWLGGPRWQIAWSNESHILRA